MGAVTHPNPLGPLDDGRVNDRELFRRWQHAGNVTARDELVHRHLPMARKLAARYIRTQEPWEDLCQVASLGLIKAIDRFDPARGSAFSSFAVPTILGELKRHFRDKGSAIHLPRSLQELVLRVKAANDELSARTGRSPTVSDVAGYLAVETEQVLDALMAISAQRAASLDADIDNESDNEPATRHDTIGFEDQRYALIERTASVAAAIKRLRASDRRVLELRVQQELKQRDIAERVGVSQMQISRILRRISEQLRDATD